MQAILQQMIVASPSVNVKSYSSKKEKSGHIKTRKRKSRDEIYVDPKEAEAASTAAKVLEEAFHQLCEMCGHYFQVSAKSYIPSFICIDLPNTLNCIIYLEIKPCGLSFRI